MAVITLTGPTCAGKSTVEAQLQKLGFGRAISHTTRAPRALETNGVAYHFVTDEEYDRLKADGEFIETIEFGKFKYAMSVTALRAAQAVSKHVAIVVDPEGAWQIYDFCKDNGMPVECVWIDCDAKDQARRWLDRFAGDTTMNPAALEAYVERLGLMLSDEVGWREQADSGLGPDYSLFLSSTKYTAEELALQVSEKANRQEP